MELTHTLMVTVVRSDIASLTNGAIFRSIGSVKNVLTRISCLACVIFAFERSMHFAGHVADDVFPGSVATYSRSTPANVTSQLAFNVISGENDVREREDRDASL